MFSTAHTAVLLVLIMLPMCLAVAVNSEHERLREEIHADVMRDVQKLIDGASTRDGTTAEGQSRQRRFLSGTCIAHPVLTLPPAPYPQ